VKNSPVCLESLARMALPGNRMSVGTEKATPQMYERGEQPVQRVASGSKAQRPLASTVCHVISIA